MLKTIAKLIPRQDLSKSAQIKLTGEGRHLSFVSTDAKFEGLCAEEGA
jgi:hypothetical protein